MNKYYIILDKEEDKKEIEEMANELKILYEILNSEKDFLIMIEKEMGNREKIRVLNFKKNNIFDNGEVDINSRCDINFIKCLSSSSFTKKYLEKIEKSNNINNKLKIEVPFIIENNEISFFGTYELKDNKYIKNEKIDKEFIFQEIEKTISKYGIQFYGSIEFNIEDEKNINTYKVERATANPLFLKDSLFEKFFEDEIKLTRNYSNINILSKFMSLIK